MSDEVLRPEAIVELVPDAAAPMAVGPGPDPAREAAGDAGSAPAPAPVPAPRDGGDVALLGLIDRLAALLDRSDLTELEVESGGTALVLRKPSALAPAPAAAVLATAEPASATAAVATAGEPPPAETRPSIKAPLTGIFYASPAPGSAPYVAVGREVAVGQVIGLIEAMKLFNEIKSDLAGRVVRVVPDSGTLVKAKQPLIEVEPL